VEKRLEYALVHGMVDFIEADTEEARQKLGRPIASSRARSWPAWMWWAILFGAGKMFLPQVVKSARAMKAAVAYLQLSWRPRRSRVWCSRAGRLLVATVKGDVHDIGKNIVGVVLGCNQN